MNPGADVPLGVTEIPVVVTYPDGSSETILAPVDVTEAAVPDVDENTPAYPETTKEQGGETTIPAPTNEDGSKLPDGTTFTPATTSPTGPPSTRTAPSPTPRAPTSWPVTTPSRSS